MRYQTKQRICANATKDITHSVHQYEIFNLLSAKDSNWKDEIFAGNFARVDMANESLGVIVEYFGDYWHCNPNTYAPDFFNVSLKMTAKEKQNSDIDRLNKILDCSTTYNLIIVVWESTYMHLITKDDIVGIIS